MQVNSHTIAEVLAELGSVAIPLYQRPYCWEAAEVTTLCEDIRTLLDNDGARHFLGSLVFEGKKGNYFLIDGQQRVTTLFLLLYALSFHDTKKALASCKFFPAEDDEEIFERIKRDDIKKDCMGNVARRFFQIRAFLDNLNDEDRKGFADALLNRLYTVNIFVDEAENAYAIFESLNSKGRSLDPFDLIRNFLLMNIPEEERRLYYRRYIKQLEDLKKTVYRVKRKDKRDIVVPIEEQCVEKFIRSYIMLSGEHVAVRDLYTFFKSAYRDFQSDNNVDARSFVIALHKCANYFDKMINPTKKVSDKKLRNQLNRLLKTDTETYFPLALSIIIKYEDEDIDIDTAIELLRVLEIFIVRTFIGNAQAKKSLDKLFPPIITKLFNYPTQDLPRTLRNLLVSSLSKNKNTYILSDEEFAEKIRLYPFYGGSNSLCHLALSTLEDEINKNEKVSADYTQIEHIMPQTLTEPWKAYLGNDWERIYTHYLDTIANLTYLPGSINKKASNHAFAQKRDLYLKSKFALNECWHYLTTWREEQMIHRGTELSRELARIWTAFTDLDLITLSESKERVSDKKIVSYTLNGKNETIPGGEGSSLMQVFYTHIEGQYPDLFTLLVENQHDLIGQKQTGFGKFRSVKIIGDGPYVVGVSTSLNQKLKDIGKTLKIMALEHEKFTAYTDTGEEIYAIIPGGLRGEIKAVPEFITVGGVSVTGNNWRTLYMNILSELFTLRMDNIDTLPNNIVSKNPNKMRAPKKITVNGMELYVEVHSSTMQKKNNIKKICEILNIKSEIIRLDGEEI
ncbi:MAG: DUF262 domain-containing HNH endonuclease family protein [Defluviitaleaceae bacterium]|nr:DUF262 domain-containing HNH endonuclease family protein [Defluviitaleaceae bacterium]